MEALRLSVRIICTMLNTLLVGVVTFLVSVTILCSSSTSLMLAYQKGWISCPRCTVVTMFTGKTKGRNGMSAFLKSNTGDTTERTR